MNQPKSRNENIIVQEFEKEILIYNLATNKAFCLNETSAIVWQLCDGQRDVSEISRNLSKRLNKSVTDDLIWLALDQFKNNGLLEQSEEFQISFNGLTRRQVIRRLGLASMITLPFVSSIVAPSSAHAQSGTNLPLLAACSSSAQCNSGNCFNSTKCCIPGSINGTPPGQGNSPVGFGGNCATLTQSDLNAQCSNFNPNSCCTGNPWVATGCTPLGASGLVQTTCNCS